MISFQRLQHPEKGCMVSGSFANVGVGDDDHNYSALKNSIIRVINSSSKTEVCFLTLDPAD
jgi:hypothetical protein